MPEFSVIVGLYNTENYIGRCIESILKQKYEDFELIVVNDGSTDRSGEICEYYAKKDKRIKVIHQKNRGCPGAKNTGMQVASGKYVAFVDSDDEVEENYLSSMAEVDENIDLVICGIKETLPDGKVVIKTKYEKKQILEVKQEDVLNMIADEAISYVFGRRFKKSIINAEKVCFDEKLDFGDDICFMAEYICRCNTIQYIDTVPYLYYRYDHATLSTIDDKCVKRAAKANEKLENVFMKYFSGVVSSKVWKKKKFELYPHCIFRVLRNEEYGNIKKYRLLKSFFAIEDIREFAKEADVYMPQDSKLIQKIIATRSPLLIMGFWIISKIKETMIFKN